MPRQFTLPDLGEGLTEAEIVAVLVREGDLVREDAPLLEVETDKAQVEIPSPIGGRVEKIHVTPGQTVKVGAVLVTFADSGAAAGPAAPPRAAAPQVAERPAPPPAPAGAAPRPSPAAPVADAAPAAGPVPATPATRRLARELGVDLRRVRGTGPGGRLLDTDVQAAARAAPGPAAPSRASTAAEPAARPAGAREAPAGPAKPLATVGLEPPPLPRFEQWGPVERVPLSHLRRTIAERMTLSATVVPHVTHFDRADITDLDAIITRNLERARERGATLTLTAFLLRAAALALRAHPHFNASLDPAAGELIVKRYRHLGVAVATPRGLIVPVLRDVDTKPLLDIARELGALAQRVRDGHASLEDLRGGTFTITNIGALGGTGAIPIINYPEVAILGVSRARLEPVVRGGQIVPRLLLPLTLTFDHRVADGADGARFASEIVSLLEAPERLVGDI
ncbi:MAG TPA: dihydrolipoamide acetyltransferase family protein [Methylomirabilota bacterium]|nr:dihydrolipoamide acetyltransferase family protein [Methylomirabilota bacterium]